MTKEPYPSEQADKFVLRLPDSMRDCIRAAAEANSRSMNAEIVARLEASCEFRKEAQTLGERLDRTESEVRPLREAKDQGEPEPVMRRKAGS